MRAKHVMLGVAALAAFWTAGYSTDTVATVCPEATIGAVGSCTINDQAISIFIEDHPVTTIYNLVDNSVTLQEISSTGGGPIINIIGSAPITTIYNLVENAINIQISETAGTPINTFIYNNAKSTIYNIVNDSISLSKENLPQNSAIVSRIESYPLTDIYNLVDNSVNVTGISASVQDDATTSQVTAEIDTILPNTLIDNNPVTTVTNLVDNSVSLQEISGAVGGSIINIVDSTPTTTIYNLIENTIDLQISDTAGIPINIFIESIPITSIYNLVDNSVNLVLFDAPTLQVAAVPEPTSLFLLMLGLGAVGLLQKRR